RTYGLKRVAGLASNENPLGPSPKALEAIRRNLSSLNHYPNSGLDLLEKLAEEYGTKVANVIAGSGSDSIVSDIIRTFLGDQDEILTTEAAFGGFQVLAHSRGVPYRPVPYKNWHYDLHALAGAISENTEIIYLSTPNKPTGTIFTRQAYDASYQIVPTRGLSPLHEPYFEYTPHEPPSPD